jgi:hypothetical protein
MQILLFNIIILEWIIYEKSRFFHCPLEAPLKGVFNVTWICSRTRDWTACVAPAKNNIICVFNVKRDKRMWDVGRYAGLYPVAEHPHA